GQGMRGFVDKAGELVVELASGTPDSCSDPFSTGFAEGLVAVRSTSNIPFLAGYVDNVGNWVIAPQFDYAADFHEGLAAAANGSAKWGYVDETGAWVIEPQFGSAGDFHEGRAVVHTDAKWGYIDKTGEVVIPMKYAVARDFSGGVAAVRPPYKSGANSPSYINTKGKVIWHGE
ncbi:MAG: WG repeat-containing protein, partial [Thermoleophilia bacterium]|nr:WG repeat-containing protein [Thermoleophilia bacterium]